MACSSDKIVICIQLSNFINQGPMNGFMFMQHTHCPVLRTTGILIILLKVGCDISSLFDLSCITDGWSDDGNFIWLLAKIKIKIN